MMPRQRPPQKQRKDQKKERAVERIRGADFARFYASNVEIGFTFFDFRFTINDLVKADKDKVVIADQAQIIMSPQHAKALARLLDDSIRKYEDEHGEIPTKSTSTEA